MAWSQEKIIEVYQRISKLATTDLEFRKELLANPCRAIERVADEKLQDEYSIKIIENDPAYWATFVLPPFNSGELSDGDLDLIAGGMSWDPFDNCGTKIGK